MFNLHEVKLDRSMGKSIKALGRSITTLCKASRQCTASFSKSTTLLNSRPRCWLSSESSQRAIWRPEQAQEKGGWPKSFLFLTLLLWSSFGGAMKMEMYPVACANMLTSCTD